jgi:hypothetical protein
LTQTNRVHAAAIAGAAGTFVLVSGEWRTICQWVAMPRGRAGVEEGCAAPATVSVATYSADVEFELEGRIKVSDYIARFLQERAM